jgi:aspartate racemase
MDLSGDPSLRAWLTEVSRSTLDAMAHSSVSLRQVLNDPASALGNQGPVFQASFSIEPLNPEADSENSLDRVLVAGVPVDFHLAVQQTGQDVVLHLLYNADLFEIDTVDRALTNLGTLLQSIAENPDLPASKLSILSDRERQHILTDWNQFVCIYPRDKCMHELVEAAVHRSPDAIAVVYGDLQLTYRDFDSRANQLAHYLKGRGIGPDVRVAICLEPTLDFAVAVLAVLKAGGACVPLDPKYPAERLAYMLEDVRAKVVITEKGLLPDAIPAGCEVLAVSEKTEELSQQPQTKPQSGATPRDIAYVIYTSGSTGKPRGVMLAHAGLVNYFTSMLLRYCMEPTDRVLQFCSTSFDIAVEELFATWVSGATLVLRPPDMSLAVPEFMDWVERQGITILDLPTAYWHEWVHALAELRRPAPPAVRLVIVGGEKALASAYSAWMRTIGHKVRWLNTYGPTEASISVTAWEGIQHAGDPIPENLPIGKPLANCRLYILDRHLNPVPVGIPGELHIGGVCVARGYLNRPELTAEKFIPDPFSSDANARLYKTGDMARYLPSGDIEFLGRADGQVKIRGFRIELGEIESVLCKHPSVREGVVIAREDVPGEKRLVAYIVPVRGSQFAEAELRGYLRQHLPEYMLPSATVLLENMPLTPNGKINRRGLPAPSAESSPAQQVAPPVDAFQAQLLKIWEDLLGRRPISIQDNFFELGGHSLLAARLMHRIGQAIGKTVPLAMLLQAPTIEQLAAALREDGWAEKWSSLVAMQPLGARPAFFCVHGVGGNVLNFRELAKRMGPDHPFYGFQAQGLDGTRPCFTRIEEIAAHYIQQIKSVQPRGPYFIGGYSFGGTVAYEMAQQLRASGEQIGMLALLDTYAGNLKSVSSTVVRLLLHPSGKRLFRDLPEIAKEMVERRIKFLLMSPILKNVLATNQAAADRYKLQPYGGRIHLFRASEASLRSPADLYAAWDELAADGVEVHEIIGNHGGILVRPQIDQLAEALKACIDRARVREDAQNARSAAASGPNGTSRVDISQSLKAAELQASR